MYYNKPNLEILEMIMDQLRGKSQTALRNTDGRKVQRLIGIQKYDSAPWAGGKKSEHCLLQVFLRQTIMF